MRIYLTPPLLIILTLGFASGLPLALTASTLSIWLTETGISKTAIGLFAAIGIPYSFKFLWAPVVDALPFPLLTRRFGRRRGWLIGVQLLLAGAIAGMGFANPGIDPWLTALAALIVASLSATQDIVIDAFRVEYLPEEHQARGAAMATLGYRIGMLASGAGALMVAEWFGWMATYIVMACLLSIGFIATLAAKEPNRAEAPRYSLPPVMSLLIFILYMTMLLSLGAIFYLSATLGSWRFLIMSIILWLAVVIALASTKPARPWIKNALIEPFQQFSTHSDWMLILLFVLLFKFGDAFLGIMTGPFLIESGFTKLQIAQISKLYGFVATILGGFTGAAMVAHLGMLRSLWICGVLNGVSNLGFLWLAHVGPDMAVYSIVNSVENLTGGMGGAVMVAYLSSLCHLRYTATQYALLSSLAAVARTLLSTPAGAAVDSMGWDHFFLLSTALTLPGLIALYALQRRMRKPALEP